jgi:predicted nucleic acid-binding protein
VYAYDAAEADKSQRARAVLDALEGRQAGFLSTQVLAEFFTSVTRRIPEPLSVAEAARSVTRYVGAWVVADVTPLVLLEAIRAVQTYPFSYWDAQIWATAKLNQAPVVLTEDFQDGRVIEGIQFRNPFASTFDLATFSPSL